MTNTNNWDDWLKAWQKLKSDAEIQIEQANLVIPVIEKKILELGAQEVKDGK